LANACARIIRTAHDEIIFEVSAGKLRRINLNKSFTDAIRARLKSRQFKGEGPIFSRSLCRGGGNNGHF